MSKVLIVVETDVSSDTISAFKQVIPKNISVQVVTGSELQPQDLVEALVCPLTLKLPTSIVFPALSVYQACQDVFGLRQRLMQRLEVETGDGCLWLPVVLTAKGPLYGEVIALSDDKQPQDLACNSSYYQPYHLSDSIRQQLYSLAHYLLRSLTAPPSVYLLQFAIHHSNVYFDRLLPFPAAPAIASLGIQEPDLFACHWACLNNQPIIDLKILLLATASY